MSTGQSNSAPTLTDVSELAIAEGQRIARKVFARRGNHSEAHLSEAELAALLAVAFHRGELKAERS